MARLTFAEVEKQAIANSCKIEKKSRGYIVSNSTDSETVNNLQEAMDWISDNYEIPKVYTQEYLEANSSGAELTMIAADGFNIDYQAFIKDAELDASGLITAILAAQSLKNSEEVEAEKIPPQLKVPCGKFNLEARKFLDRWVLAMVKEDDPKIWTLIEDCDSEEEARAKLAQQLKDYWTY